MATKKLTQAQKIRTHAAAYPNRSIKEIAEKLGITYGSVYQVLKPSVKVPKQLKWRHVTVATSDESLEGAARLEANHIFELTKGRERRHPVTGKILMQAATREEKISNPAVYEVPADSVNHPAHYKVGGIETIDFIEAKGLNYHLGNVVKYITRADTKGSREEDLLKARWYLNREIAKLGK
jgi:hypothetical protein